MKNSRILLLLMLLLFAGTVSAHKDRILTILPDGSIPEIPAALGPVSLKISGLGSSTLSVQFRSGARVNDLPGCATRFIRSKHTSDVFVSGSWYHDESSTPYYVSVKFRDPGHTASKHYNSSVNILFSLRTAEAIEIERFEAEPSGNGGRYVKVDLPKGCTLQPHAA